MKKVMFCVRVQQTFLSTYVGVERNDCCNIIFFMKTEINGGVKKFCTEDDKSLIYKVHIFHNTAIETANQQR